MEFRELDHFFDEALKRFDTKQPAASDPYAQGPHSADHFLLKKSWDYFKERVRSIEDHWTDIANSKDKEIVALKEELRLSNEQLAEAELKTQMLDKFEEEVRKTRASDFVDFQRLSDRLRQAWEEERQALAVQLSAVEFALQAEREKNRTLAEDSNRRLRGVGSQSDVLKEENARIVQKHAEDKRLSHEADVRKDEELNVFSVKISRLQLDLERRDQKIAEQAAALDSFGTKVDALLLRIKQTDEAVSDRETRIKNLAADVERLQYEKESLKKAWVVEQAQWRELWERSRELWDKNQKDKNK